MEFVSFAGLAALPSGADALFRQAEQGSLFLSRAWFESLIDSALPHGQSVAFTCVVDGAKVLAMLPLMTGSSDVWSSLGHRYTPLYAPLLADEDQQRVLECLCDGLRASGMDSLLLAPVSWDDSRLHRFRRNLEQDGAVCELSFRFYNWVLRLKGQSFADYMAARPAQLRNTIARKARRLSREHGYEVHLYAGAEVPPAMADYHAVYTASWKANEQYRDFLDLTVAAFSESGWSRLGVLSTNGKPAAAQLWFVGHGKAYIFRLAYDQAWRGYSPGSILTARMMEHVIDIDQVRMVDFLTGNEPYKQEWMSERRERVAFSCVYPRSSPGKLSSVLGRLRMPFTKGR